MILTAGLNLFYGRGEPLWQFGFMTITEAGITNAVFIALRIISLIFISSVLTFTTSPTDLTDALERLMKPLKVLHISVHEIAMMMTIALRFVPTLLEETDKIMSAQKKARGADLESGGLFQRIKALVPILIPLFVSSFRRAYELAMAMECRCYQGAPKDQNEKHAHDPAGWIRNRRMCVILAGVVLCNVFYRLRSGDFDKDLKSGWEGRLFGKKKFTTDYCVRRPCISRLADSRERSFRAGGSSRRSAPGDRRRF